MNLVSIDSPANPVILETSNVTYGCPRTGDGFNGNACTAVANTPVCGVGADCTDLWSSVLCECPDDKSGNRCQDERVIFGKVLIVFGFLKLIVFVLLV